MVLIACSHEPRRSRGRTQVPHKDGHSVAAKGYAHISFPFYFPLLVNFVASCELVFILNAATEITTLPQAFAKADVNSLFDVVICMLAQPLLDLLESPLNLPQFTLK